MTAYPDNPFRDYHPAAAAAYLACALAITMAAMQPAFVAISLAGALACSAVCRGGRATLLSLRWVVPLCLVVAAANPLFVASGSTELFRIGPRAVYAEALLYGLCSGAMFAAVFLWFASWSASLDSEGTLALLGNAAPVVTLMASQVMRLVPQFLKRGRAILAVQRANTAGREGLGPSGAVAGLGGADGESASRSGAGEPAAKQAARERMRVVSVLVGWGMEDGLQRADAMRARGFGCGVRRTTYKRFRLGRADAAVLACTVALASASAACAWAAVSGYSFYPTADAVSPWWGYVPYALFAAFPAALWAKGRLQWR